MDLNGACKGGDGFIDRRRVRILLCDNDSKSLGDVFTLLSECSYQVTSVKSARQVIDALNAEGPDIDIILAEIDLPMSKGMKMLRYITRDKDLRRIPVIMMSRQDEVAVVVKCLKLGAADYLVKPLRTNELLNLWTHMWRRRRMLGLAEKNMLSYDIDFAGSDPSDPNTNSTNLFSDDTDDRNLQRGTLSHHEEFSAPAYAGDRVLGADGSATSTPAVAAIETDDARSHFKKNRLKIGESSAFFTYVKSNVLGTSSQDPPYATGNGSLHLHSGIAEKLQVVATERINNTKKARRGGENEKNYSQQQNLKNGVGHRNPLERSQTLPTSMELHRNYQDGNMNTAWIATKDTSQADGSVFSTQNPYPYYIHGVMNQVMMQSAAMMPQYGHHQLPHCPPYHHPSLQNNQMSLQNGQVSMFHHSWSPIGNVSSNRREEALLKFRRKRNQRCFDKKIRYENRKRLAERRPRVKGQFVRKRNGVNVDLNGQPGEEEEEEEEEELENGDSSPQDDALGT